MLMALYIFNVFAVGYIVFALERNHGTCMQYKDVVWMMGVTITNLGFGDFTPSSSGMVDIRDPCTTRSKGHLGTTESLTIHDCNAFVAWYLSNCPYCWSFK